MTFYPSRDAERRNRLRVSCRGLIGAKHRPAIRLDHLLAGDSGRCKPAPSWFVGGRWWCHHQEVCRVCGVVLRYGIPAEECPEYLLQTQIASVAV